MRKAPALFFRSVRASCTRTPGLFVICMAISSCLCFGQSSMISLGNDSHHTVQFQFGGASYIESLRTTNGLRGAGVLAKRDLLVPAISRLSKYGSRPSHRLAVFPGWSCQRGISYRRRNSPSYNPMPAMRGGAIEYANAHHN